MLLKTQTFVLHTCFVYNLITVYVDFTANCVIYHSISYSVEIVYKNQIESFIYGCQEPDGRKHLLLEE